jgi:hypothetical protein
VIGEEGPIVLVAFGGNAPSPYVSYIWNNGHTSAFIQISKSGRYSVQVMTKCSQDKDTVEILYENTPLPDLAQQVDLCVGDTLKLNASTTYAKSYLWKDASTLAVLSTRSSLQITEPGVYLLEATNVRCTGKHTLTVNSVECEKNLYIPNVITANGDGANDRLRSGAYGRQSGN